MASPKFKYFIFYYVKAENVTTVTASKTAEAQDFYPAPMNPVENFNCTSSKRGKKLIGPDLILRVF